MPHSLSDLRRTINRCLDGVYDALIQREEWMTDQWRDECQAMADELRKMLTPPKGDE